MSADVLVLTVPIVGAYAGMNDVAAGWGAGRKSPAYLDLFRGVREAAREAMASTGWTTVDQPCAVEIVRYHATRRIVDCGNLGKAEMDAMAPSTPNQEARDRIAPFAGVYANDKLARPYSADVEYDPAGPDRVVVIVRRRFPDVLAADVAPRKTRAKASVAVPASAPALVAPAARTAPKTTGWRAGDPIPPGFALLGAELVPIAEALALIGGDRKDAAPRARRGAR